MLPLPIPTNKNNKKKNFFFEEYLVNLLVVVLKEMSHLSALYRPNLNYYFYLNP